MSKSRQTINSLTGFQYYFSIGNEQRLTWVHTNAPSLANNALSAGIPSYVIQEEFCRFQGFWWQPVMSGMLLLPIICLFHKPYVYFPI